MGRDSSSRHRRKRKGEKEKEESDSDKRRRSASPEKNEESLSIEETNKLRASLGLAPLEVDDGPKVKESATGEGDGEKVIVEDGMEFVHKVPEHIGVKKRAEDVREKIQVAKEKRRLESKMFKLKGLADSDSDEDASAWVKKNREAEEERKRAEQRAKLLDDMDAEFGVDSLLLEEKSRKQKAMEARRQQKKSDLAGMIVGHSKDDFLDGRETVLVLDDRDVLEEGDEVLVNPNLVENKRYEKNAELRKKKDRYEPYKENVDEFGMPKSQGVLSKYNEELNGEERVTFRLDESGEVDVEREQQESEIRRNLLLANKKLVSLDTPAYKIASEFYTEEEMISFRKPKKKKDGKKVRKRKTRTLKADDLLDDGMDTGADVGGKGDTGHRKATDTRTNGGESQSRRSAVTKEGEQGTGKEVVGESAEGALETGEFVDDAIGKEEKWQTAATSGLVDVQQLNKFVENEVDDDSDDEFLGGVDVTGVAVEDDAEEELASMLDHARKLRQLDSVKKETDVPDSAAKVREMLVGHVKNEPMDSDEEPAVSDVGVVIDSTMEYCRNLGEIPTYGLAGNRKDAIDVSELKEPEEERRVEEEQFAEEKSKIDERGGRDEESAMDGYEEAVQGIPKKGKGKWLEATATTSALDDDIPTPWRRTSSESDEESDEEMYNVLGEERDVTKGVAAMLKLAGEKGYLESGKARKVNGPSLKHLESKRFSQIESGRYDIEEKYTKKLERMGTTGTGPVRPFPEKPDYKPNIQITYIDQRGREMEPKDAFRVLSWKFHGKGPGKKQIEKRQAKLEKKEVMKKMNSMDTPLGTLGKQLKKQESLQSPYIILSGSGKDVG